MDTAVFLLVLGSAFTHAGWNFAARKVSGNFIVLWISLWIGALFLLPGVFIVLIKLDGSQVIQTRGIPFMISTGLIHAVYFTLLGISYKHGEISMVYPIARGSGVGLTAICAKLIFAESISFFGVFGISLVSLSILSIGFSSSNNPSKAKSIMAALCLGMTICAYSLVDKMGVVYVHPVIYIWFLFFITAIVLTPFIIGHYRDAVIKTVMAHYKSAIVIGVGSIITYLMILVAFTFGHVSYIVAVREFAVVLGAVAGIVFLKEKFSLIKIASIIGITIGIICIKIV